MSVEIKTLANTIDAVTLNKIRAVALGRSMEIPRMRVIARLPLLDVNASESLVSIAGDVSVPQRLRQVAIGSLGRLKQRPFDVLQRLAQDADAGVASAAVKVLGRTANPDALPILAQVARHADAQLRKRVDFSAALIAHRFNLPGHDLPSVKLAHYLEMPRPNLGVKARPTTPEEHAAVMSSLAQHALALPAQLATWDLECGKKRWALVLDNALLSPWKPSEFVAKKMHLGQLAMRNHVTGTYAPGLAFLLTGHGAKGFEVGMYRANGELIFGGEGKLVGDMITFAMHGTDRPGAAATTLEGSYGPSGLELKIISSITRLRPALNPTSTPIK